MKFHFFRLSRPVKPKHSKGDNMRRKVSFSFCVVLALLVCLMAPAWAGDQRPSFAPVGSNLLPDGFYITPTAAPGSIFQNLPTGLRPDGTANANGAVNTEIGR